MSESIGGVKVFLAVLRFIGGIVITTALLYLGITVYDTPGYTMTLVGIKVTKTIYLWFIILLYVLDFGMLYSSLRKRKKQESTIPNPTFVASKIEEEPNQICPNCGNIVPPREMFCMKCNARLK